MITSKKCPTCGVVSKVETLDNRCPACGEPYRTAAPDAGGFATEPAAPATPTPARARKAPLTKPTEKFIVSLRAQSNYPTFRGLVNIGAWLFYIGVAITILGLFFTEGAAGFARGYLIAALAVAVVFVAAAREASLMLADLSDAAVYNASRER